MAFILASRWCPAWVRVVIGAFMALGALGILMQIARRQPLHVTVGDALDLLLPVSLVIATMVAHAESKRRGAKNVIPTPEAGGGAKRISLNGWQRLWLVASLLLAGLTVGFGFIAMPEEESVAHNSQFESALSDEAKTQIARPDDATGSTVGMPNGHQITLKAGIEAKRSTIAVAEYYSELQRQLAAKRQKFVVWLAVGWAAIAAASYAMGWAVRWIRRGFAPPRTAA